MVQWVVQSHGIPLVPHGTVGGTIPWDPTSPTWYSGTGWTGRMAVPAMGWWYNPMGSPSLMVQWDGMGRLSQPWDGGTIPWDPTSSTGTRWTGGMAVPTMGRWYNPMGSPCLMVQWDEMDRWHGCPSYGSVVQSHGIPLVPHGTVGRDGQVGWLSQPWDGGKIPWDPTSPTGTGWTGGMAVPTMGWWYNSMGSPSLMVQWDGMDRWDGCRSHGTVVQSHGIPLVPHCTVGQDGQVEWLTQPSRGGTIPWDPTSPTWYSGWYNPMGSH